MKQYDLCRNKGRAQARSPYLLIIQRDGVSGLPTRLVAPVMRLTPEAVIARIMVPVDFEDEKLHISLPEMFSIDKGMLGNVVGNLSDLHVDIVRSLDMLVTG
jgi:CcdB protein